MGEGEVRVVTVCICGSVSIVEETFFFVTLRSEWGTAGSAGALLQPRVTETCRLAATTVYILRT